MAQTDALKKYLDAGMAFTQVTRKRAEQVVKELVAAGELHRSQAKSAIEDLIERSRSNAELLSEQVRKEVASQLARLHGSGDEPVKAEAAKHEPAKPAKNTADSNSDGDKPAPPKKAPPKKAPPKEAPATKAPATKAPSKKQSSSMAPVSGELPAKKASATKAGGGKPAKAADKATKKQG